MASSLYYHNTGEGMYNPNNGFTYKWTGRDYVPYFIWSDVGTWYWDTLVVYNATSTYDLSKLSVGHEASFYLAIITNPSGSADSGTMTIKIWRKLTTSGSETLQFTYNYSYSNAVGYGTAAWAGTGVDYDEEWDNIQYIRYETLINGVSQGSKTVTYINLQTYSAKVVGTTGNMWIEGENIWFIDGAYDGSRYAKHAIRHDGTTYSSGKTPGMLWIDQVNHGKIAYVDQYGVERKTFTANNYWNQQQLATGRTPGMWWVSDGWDTYSYFNFIGYDGKHYCIMNGTSVWY